MLFSKFKKIFSFFSIPSPCFSQTEHCHRGDCQEYGKAMAHIGPQTGFDRGRAGVHRQEASHRSSGDSSGDAKKVEEESAPGRDRGAD